MAHRGRLTRQQFARVFNQGRRRQHRWFTLRELRPDEAEGPARWGIAVGKRLAPSSVERNRLRRRLAAALQPIDAPCGTWIVVQLKSAGIGASVAELQREIESVLQRRQGSEDRQCLHG